MGDRDIWRNSETFYRKYLKNYLVLLFVIAVGIDLVIETAGAAFADTRVWHFYLGIRWCPFLMCC